MSGTAVLEAPAEGHYQYHSEDRSLLLAWLTGPVFLPIVRRLPRHVTPNQVTLVGHASMVASGVMALLAVPPLRLTLFALAAGSLAFNVADTVDGMYARHSGRASARGELYDHGLDPVSLGVAVLAYGAVMQEPPWLILLSTAVIGLVHILTFLHGYRIGHVILGEIGIIEGLAVATLVFVAAGAGAHDWLVSMAFADVPKAGILALAIVLGSLSSLPSMRGLVAHLGDAVPVLLLYAAAVAWFRFGDLGVIATGLLIVAASAYQAMLVTSSRLRRRTLRLWEPPFIGLAAAAVAISVGLRLGPAAQTWLASGVIACLGARTAYLFSLTLGVTPVPSAPAAASR